MKLVRFKLKDDIYNGILEGDKVTADAPGAGRKSFETGEVTLLAPVAPSKVVSVGLNYRDHAAELGMEIPDEPIIFIKPSTSVIGPEEDVIYPPSSGRVDYEAELGVVIRDRVKDVPPEKVMPHILGYTCVNDVTARDLQKKDGQWTRSKSFDTFSPIGPWVVTDLAPDDLSVRAYLNGELKQDSRTSNFIFGIPELVSFVSGIMTLLPCDIISTGTPAGIGPMRPGDEIVIEIEGIGRLRNVVKG
jgi:2-keto-4-pentenoate hydratase/2-oxohepta-3-ene-1,7-dioic acid hydratase in catechol pathway